MLVSWLLRIDVLTWRPLKIQTNAQVWCLAKDQGSNISWRRVSNRVIGMIMTISQCTQLKSKVNIKISIGFYTIEFAINHFLNNSLPCATKSFLGLTKARVCKTSVGSIGLLTYKGTYSWFLGCIVSIFISIQYI